MNKINKYISLATVALIGAGGMMSCDDSKDSDFVTEYDGPSGIYFSNTENAYLELSEDQTTITYHVFRDVAGEEVTVAIAVSPMGNYSVKDIYTFPESVTFPAGSKVADFIIGYDISKAQIGVEQQYQLVLDAEPNPFSSNEIVITLVNPAPWTLLGTNGKYYDFAFGVSEDSTGPATVSVWQQGLDPNLFRISNPYIAYNDDENSYFQFRVLQPGDVFFGVTITQPDIVAYDMYFITYDSEEDTDLYVAFPAYFMGFESESSWIYNRVIGYQDNGLPGEIMLSPIYYYDGKGGADMSKDGPISIIFPDYVALDTDMEVNYEGVLTPENQIQEVLLSVILGADLNKARAAVTEGSDGDALITAIEDGSAKYVEFNDSGNVKIPFGNENPTGYYTAAVVAYNGNDVKATDYVTFLYISTSSNYDPNEGWKSLGYVDYSDGFVCSCPVLFLPEPLQTYSVEIQESEETAGIYRLVNPYGAAYPYSNVEEDNPYLPKYLYIDASNPDKVVILESPQDLTLYAQDQYGNVVPATDLTLCWSLADYYRQNGYTDDQIAAAGAYFGTYTNNKITFPAAFIQTQNGEQFLNSALIANWEFPDYPEDDGLYSANLVMDYDSYQKSGETDPYLYVSPGKFYAPFLVDMSTLTQTANYRQNGQVMLTSHAMRVPGQKYIMAKQKANKQQLHIPSKTRKFVKKQIVPMEKVR